MAFNGAGLFVINSTGNPVVTGTTIASTWANALTADLATGLSTAILKDGTQAITANIPFGSFKITGLGNGTASTDAVNLGQIQGAFQGTGYTTTATAAGTTTLTVASTTNQYFTGVTTQTVTLPVVTTLPALGFPFRIVNLSSGTVTVNSSGGNLVATVTANQQVDLTCILLTGTAAASWNVEYSGATAITGTGPTVRATSPTLVTPILGAATATSLTFANEAMSSYDEFTFVPVLRFGGASVGITYSDQSGRGVKIGKTCYVRVTIGLSNKGSSSGAASVSGFPYTVVNATYNVPLGLQTSSITYPVGGLSPFAYGAANATVFTLAVNITAAATSDILDTGFTNSSSFTIYGVYETTTS